ncbi:hypothetical protein [Desulfobulbus oralis]|uniref:Uncharacterized protein n=1 Tax=Desulfobulbus oralis TaxID=1986146 RepID=A0A2L1GMN2_9BACT|nr:hypothetical protein [Desulfobulbus oralis]AVD70945.1 hypothetical protein CAY53_05160 [Desulfobulbus oralis]
MSLGRRKAEQKSLWLSYEKIPQSKGHLFYERLQNLLRQSRFYLQMHRSVRVRKGDKDRAGFW